MAKLAKPLNPMWRRTLLPAMAAKLDTYERSTLRTYAAKLTNAAVLWNAARAEYDAKASGALVAVKLHARKLARMERVCARIDAALDRAMESGAPEMEGLADLSGRAWVEMAAREEMHGAILRRVPKGDPGTLAEFMKAQRDAYKGARETCADLRAVFAMVRANGIESVTEDEARAWGTRFKLDDVVL